MEILQVGRDTEPVPTGDDAPLIQDVTDERGSTEAGTFGFDVVEGHFEKGVLGNSLVAEAFVKWGLGQNLVLERFRFNGRFTGQEKNTESFLLDLFNSSQVKGALAQAVAGKQGTAVYPSDKVQKVTFEELAINQLDLSIFNRLKDDDLRILGKNGYLRKCFPETFEGASTENLLQDLFLNEDSENGWAYSEAERKELLFRLLRWLVVGGSLSQPDETIDPYFSILKQVFKSLVQVVKRSEKIESISRAFIITELDDSNAGLFPKENSNNLCLVIVTPTLGTVTFLNSAFIPFLG